MGYFRFRRSFKIVPGLWWNIGKKSSSVSLGGRGLHYTIGPSGTRTTVGLPGTGLSYISGNRRKQAHKLSDNEISKAIEWSKKQEESFQLHLPDRILGEPPATPDQIATIHGLVHSMTGLDMTNLGCKQAAFLIDEIKREKDCFTERKVHEYLDRRRHMSGAGCLFLIVVVVVIACVFLYANH